ncbi:MAG: dienelactone hydrolase family protein [Chloroflexota bacterium]
MSIQKSDLTLEVNGQPVKAYLAAPENGGPGVLLLHAWWGLKPFFKEVCDHLAEQGFTVLAPDLFAGQVAATIEAATELAENSDTRLVGDTVMAAKDALLARTGGKIGVVGFSFGAAWSLVAAQYAPDEVAATVLFYGIYGVDFNKVKSKILGHFSDNDEWEPLAGVRAVETEMKAAGLDVIIHVYPGVSHWFVESDRPEYAPAAASLAWERTLAFLKENLG